MQNSWFYCRLFTKFDVLCHFFINTAVDAIKVNKKNFFENTTMYVLRATFEAAGNVESKQRNKKGVTT